MRTGLLRALCILLCTSVGFGQAQDVKLVPQSAAGSGAVTGHVYFAGANGPARFVQIGLQPTTFEHALPGQQLTTSVTIYQTGLDGSFLIPHVFPGTYYLVALQPGFASPFALFTMEELEHPSEAVQRRMAGILPVVTVQPSSTVTMDLTLGRGASLSGTVRFDDGTPFAQADIDLTQRAPDGTWTFVRVVNSHTQTDGEGHYLLGGLPPGEYRLGVLLNLQEQRRNSVLGENRGSATSSGYSLSVWLGDTTRESHAKSVTLTENEAMQDQDITIPVSKLHRITGAIVDQNSGQALNAGYVMLMDADDRRQLASAQVDADTRTFTLPFVPEGKYKMQAIAREVRYEPPANPEANPIYQNRQETILRSYGPVEVPLLVQSDLTGVILPVREISAKTP